MGSFNHDILSIIPDEDVQVKLPKPKKHSVHKRYQTRAVSDNTPIIRAGNFNYEHLEHDENCTHNHIKRGSGKGSPKKHANKKTNKKITARKSIKKSAKKSTKNFTIKEKKNTNSNRDITSRARYSQQPDADWNLVRISQRRPNYRNPYSYSSSAG